MGISKVDIVIVDVDSADSCSGMTYPAADFVDESFLQALKDALSEKGLFIINLVSRSRDIKDSVYFKDESGENWILILLFFIRHTTYLLHLEDLCRYKL
ncbi:hypothetical protein M0R45_020314 [Rubus argutus]|uniref:Uncharacterized protein n=1 Tax=Rubus argutus TaxID=59490 RepID=A0AAW1XBI8_RUBAR